MCTRRATACSRAANRRRDVVSRRGIARRVVVQDLPAVSPLLQEQRERSTRGHRVAPPQLEPRGTEREIEREGARAHLAERERVAELAGREIAGLVPVVQRLPAVLYVAA